MTTRISAFQNRLATVQQSQDQWKADHDEAMECLDIEGYIARVLAVYEDLQDLQEARGFLTTEIEMVAVVYRQMYGAGVGLTRAGEVCRKQGYDVIGLDRLISMTQSLSSHMNFLEDMVKSVNAVQSGKGRTVRDLLNELRSSSPAKH